ncbi:MAG: acetyl-CoA carboxylase biotin carboxylase subunit [Acidobacteria bacterium]|nr:acetyl-CoA carboxylase biotin carboxylase subunit [Acidobacteriota bacterium]MBI3657989.1 acetyl-CoA carboxylase biotin carboxylase subunit [Acidobacteriota bacterium]
MFRKVLIANRGEIAMRVILACKELGVQTVVVYSEADRLSLPVRMADEAVCIGPAPNSESYLNIPAIISAAEVTNVDAIHPGYGFLAENANFAEICIACGIMFIGPPPKMIKLMGDKALAREVMQQRGLSVLPGTDRINGSKHFERLAEQIGYPVIIKAVAGGGGKGMRVVRDPGELSRSVELAQVEAGKAFVNPAVYVEKYLEHPRHIEFQVIVDRDGNAVHLGERECSIQRRHQKLLEEAPSVAVTAEQRAALGEKVALAVRDLGYESVGTLEFLMDPQGHFYFMEMNTRIQVEHPVTEAVTGIDLVKEQILVAAGESLSFRQQDIEWRGHCIECRINAECPDTFVPSPGTITAFIPPGGPGIRVDTAAFASLKISQYYDSMIAKLIAYGPDRTVAIQRMRRALDTMVVEGVKTTIPLHQKILRHSDFTEGRLSTSFLERINA